MTLHGMSSLEDIKKRLSVLAEDNAGSKQDVIPLGVFSDKKSVYLSITESSKKHVTFLKGSDGFSFETTNEIGLQNKAVTSYPIGTAHEKGFLVSGYKYNDKYVAYYGERAINIAYSTDLHSWEEHRHPVIVESNPVEIANAFEFEHGILLIYHKKTIEKGKTHYQTYIALADKNDPSHLLWKMTEPAWDQKDYWPHKTIVPVGTIFFDNYLISYWYVDNTFIQATVLSGFHYDPKLIKINKKLKLAKYEQNPVISPKNDSHWESFTTFNPAAAYVDDKVHILYRAQGFDYISAVGYAASKDGYNIDERLPHPVYNPHYNFEMNPTSHVNYNFVSGGGYGGCEDPRITVLDDKLYMVYVAFDGWSPPRLALTSILLNDFLNKRWNWTKPVLISRPKIVDKSGCLLPEKVRGKYVIFHRIFPNILIDYVDDLNFDGKSKWLEGKYSIKIRPDMWDSRKIGAGAPPLKTDDGWLLIYYGVDDKDASKYHIGAMILDYEHPEKVLYRSNHPILEPSEDYENNGFKPGIAYPCGAVIIKDQLIVYYGGSDSVVCVATAPLKQFLTELKTQHGPHLNKIQIKEITY
jgi:predicted GH43/DUF377 family glycosyl hydrolase